MPLDQGTKARSRLEIDASTFTHEGALLVPADALLYFVAESSQPLDFALASQSSIVHLFASDMPVHLPHFLASASWMFRFALVDVSVAPFAV